MQAATSINTDAIVRMRQAGMSYRAIGRQLNCSPSTVRFRSVHCGAASQPASAIDRATTVAQGLGYDSLITALQELAAQHTCQEMADLFKVHYQTMYSWIRRGNVASPVRKPHPSPTDSDLAASAAQIALIDAIPYCAPHPDGRPVELAPGERWCQSCGESAWRAGACPRCDGHDWVDPRTVLREHEWVAKAGA